MSLVDLEYYKDNLGDLPEISKLLKELRLYTFYEKINKELGNNEAKHNCEVCNTMLSSISSEEPQLLQLCKRFCNIISQDSELNLYSKDPSLNISCTYMNLFLYSNVISITEKFDIIEKFYTAVQTISKIPRSAMKFCDIKNYKYHREQFKNLKYLYEFLFTYYDINGKISPHLNTNDQLYCNYIKENFRLYNDIKEKCPTVGICPYSKELGEIKKIFITQNHLSQIYGKCNYVQTPCKEDSDETNDIPCLKEIVSHSPHQIIEPASDHVVNQITKVLTYSIPSVATLTMLYKFTPIGSWLYSKIKRTNNMENSINAENYYISHHNTRIEEIDPGNSSNNTY